jgi:hypothetical protein
MVASVAGCMVTLAAAVAVRVVMALAETSTIVARPSASK